MIVVSHDIEVGNWFFPYDLLFPVPLNGLPLHSSGMQKNVKKGRFSGRSRVVLHVISVTSSYAVGVNVFEK